MTEYPKTANEAFTNLMGDFGIEVDPSLLPGPDTPLPPSNATRHILCREIGYGTPDREFVMFCGTRWKAANGGSGGEHQYFYRDETWWHQHVTCDACKDAFRAG